MAAKAQDYTKAFNDFVGAFPIDLSAYQDAFKNLGCAERKDRFGRSGRCREVERSLVEVAQDTLAKLGTVSKAKNDPADYSKAMTDFASASLKWPQKTSPLSPRSPSAYR